LLVDSGRPDLTCRIGDPRASYIGKEASIPLTESRPVTMFEANVVIPVAGSTKSSVWTFAEQAVTVIGVHRDGARRLPSGDIGQRGAYLLVGPVRPDGSFDAYAGAAWAQRLGVRVPRQLHDNAWAVQAFAMHRDTPGGLAESHARFLERALYELAMSTPACHVRNGVAPTAGAVTDIETRWLAACLQPFLSVLDLAGYRLGPDGARTKPEAVSIADLLGAGLVTAGERLVPGWTPAGVPPAIVTAEGNLRWRGRDFSGHSPSVPARLARGGRHTNGWDYWRVRRASKPIRLDVLRQQYRATRAA
jgi:hypothetical protein